MSDMGLRLTAIGLFVFGLFVMWGGAKKAAYKEQGIDAVFDVRTMDWNFNGAGQSTQLNAKGREFHGE